MDCQAHLSQPLEGQHEVPVTKPARYYQAMDHADHASAATTTVHCPLCERNVPSDYTCNHYLVPKSRKGRETIRLCEDCNKQIHALFKPKDLEKRLSTIELLKADEKVRTWIEWIGKRKV